MHYVLSEMIVISLEGCDMKRRTENDTLIITNDYNETVLTLKVTREENITSIFATGRITHDAAPEFEDELMSILTTGCDVVVDFTSLDYISAPALSTLLSVQKLVDEKRYKFYIQNISESVRKIFEETGFIDLLEIR